MRRQITEGKRELVLEAVDDVKGENAAQFVAGLVWMAGGDEEEERDAVFEIVPRSVMKAVAQ